MRFKKQYTTEKEIIDGCLSNDRVAQELLYRRYFDTMFRMCMRYTNDTDTAMEILNTGFLRVFKKLDTYAFNGSFEGWIRRIVFHSLSDYFKKNAKPVYFLDIEDRDTPVKTNALHNLYLEDILKLVELLPEATRDVFYLYAIEGYSHVEIAKLNNISVGTSKWHLSNARQRLKQLIETHYNHAG
ncbi:MAG TPA: sigma-70 family RNA polymerase sigma factor [Saprospiraceae bacterium]|nr:sigma-70 family RNA polymerase sigma factor [Saprospiraceae bacterium]HMQ83717.1 sigma-70 family RNA polymerase sigma factor [Saprospiraceae bacterium]